jgi:hypothetical protein
MASIITIDIQRVEEVPENCKTLKVSTNENNYKVSWVPIADFSFSGFNKGCDCGGSDQKLDSSSCLGSCTSVPDT